MMAIEGEALDIILRLQGVPSYQAGMREASRANEEFAASSKKASGASDKLAASSDRAARSNKVMAAAGKGLAIVLGAAMVEGFTKSVKFNRQMELIATQAGGTQREVDNLKKSVLGLAGKVPQGPIELAEGLYHLESIGIRGAAAMRALHESANAAAVGQADLESVTTALGAAWINNVKGAGDFHHVLATLNATAGAGNMRMEQLVRGLSSGVLPAAKIAGLSLESVGAAMATLNDAGYSSYSAMAQFGTALHFLYDPTTKAKKALEEMGITAESMRSALTSPGGIVKALELIKEGMAKLPPGEAKEALGSILPGGRGKVLLALLENLERVKNKEAQIKRTSGEFSGDVARTMEQPAVRMSRAWSGLQATLIKVGQAIEGPATKAVEIFTGALREGLNLLLGITNNGELLIPIIVGLAGAWGLYKASVIGAALAIKGFNIVQAIANGLMIVGDVVAGILEGELVTLAAVLAAITLPVDAIVAAVIAAVVLIAGGIYLLITHSRAFRQFWVDVWKAIKRAVVDVWDWIKSHWRLLAVILGGPIGIAAVFIVNHWKQIKQAAKDVWEWLKGVWRTIEPYIVRPFEEAWMGIKKRAHEIVEAFEWVWRKIEWLWGKIKSPFATVFNFVKEVGGEVLGFLGVHKKEYAMGGTMPYGGLATINEQGPGETVWLPGGASVQPSPASSLLQVRAHTPNPAPLNMEKMQLNLVAYLELPRAAGRSLYELNTKEAAIRQARR